MAQLQDIPRLASEFVDMARTYLVQETAGAARRLGRFGGMSLAAGALWAFAVLLLAYAGVRSVIDLLPESAYWEALGYLIGAIALVIIAVIIIRLVPSTPRIPPPSEESLP